MKILNFDKNEKRTILLLIIGAFFLRLLLMAYLESYIIESSDTTDGWNFGYETGRIAKSLASGEGISSPFQTPTGPTSWLMPGYPLLLAFIFKLFGIYTTKAAIATLAINCLISALTVIPVYCIAKRLFSPHTGYLASIIFVLYPPSIWHAINTIWDTTLFTFLATSVVYVFIKLSEETNLKNTCYVGLFLGFVILVNPIIILFYPLGILWWLLQIRVNKWRSGIYVSLIVTCLCLSLSPWILRNYLLFNQILLRSNFGLELKIGNNDMVWEAYISGKSITQRQLSHPTQAQDEFNSYSSMGELQYLKKCSHEAITFIKSNPYKFLHLTIARISKFWIGEINIENEWKGNIKTIYSLDFLKKIFIIAPLPFIIIGIIASLVRRIDIFLPVAFILTLPSVYYITHISNRYRFQIEPMLIIIASYGLLCSLNFLYFRKR